MNNLPNTSFNYDPSRIDEMQGFLDYIATIIKDNPNFVVDDNVVYNELCKWGIKNTDLNNQRSYGDNIGPLFSMWIARYRNHQNIDVFCSESWPYFCQFTHELEYEDSFIKLYVPLDKDHLLEGANQLFDYIERLGVKHQSKIGKHIRSDNVVIRLSGNDIENAKKIINFVNTNPYIKRGMNFVNPFVPTVNGVGVMMESGISYNKEICEQIASYLNILKNQGKYYGTVEEFRNFVNKNAYHDEVKDTLNMVCANGVKKVTPQQNVKKVALTDDQKYSLFMDAMKATLRIYGMEQVKMAVYSAVAYGDYKYFSNGHRAVQYRDELVKNVSPSDLGRMIYSTLESSFGRNNMSVDLSINVANFCDLLFRSSQALLLDEISAVTIENHNIAQLQEALFDYISFGKTDKFSRYMKDSKEGTNYRKMVGGIDRTKIIELIRTSLALKGKTLNTNNSYDIIAEYVKTIGMGKYAQNNQIEGLARKAL